MTMTLSEDAHTLSVMNSFCSSFTASGLAFPGAVPRAGRCRERWRGCSTRSGAALAHPRGAGQQLAVGHPAPALQEGPEHGRHQTKACFQTQTALQAAAQTQLGVPICLHTDHQPCQPCWVHGESTKWAGNLCCLLAAKEGAHLQPPVPTLTGCLQELSVSKGHFCHNALVKTLHLGATSSPWGTSHEPIPVGMPTSAEPCGTAVGTSQHGAAAACMVTPRAVGPASQAKTVKTVLSIVLWSQSWPQERQHDRI